MITPEKEPLIENLLYLRDLVCLAGRRRNGKTALVLNLAISLAYGLEEFLGYKITRSCKVAAVLLEDDTREIQDNLGKMIKGKNLIIDQGDLVIVTRADFMDSNTVIGVDDSKFISSIKTFCESVMPDVLILDNAAQLCAGDVNNPKMVHKMTKLCWDISQNYNCAVVIAAHPRKRGDKVVDLVSDPEGFFEEVMGLSHFVNSFGSLWGLQRNQDDITIFLGGAQRYTGSEMAQSLILNEDKWFEFSGDINGNIVIVTNTKARRQAWEALKGEFTFTEACKACSEIIRSRHAFSDWWKQLQRCGVIVNNGDPRKFIKISRSKKGTA